MHAVFFLKKGSVGMVTSYARAYYVEYTHTFERKETKTTEKKQKKMKKEQQESKRRNNTIKVHYCNNKIAIPFIILFITPSTIQI